MTDRPDLALSPHGRRTPAVLGLALALGVAVVAGFMHESVGAQTVQQPPSGTPPPVTFKAETSYVDVDAIVTDRQGNVVRGLTKDDFQILEDGKPQAITNFLEVRGDEAPSAPQPGAAPAAPLAPTDPRARNIVVFLAR